jgi:hypothetical protein
MRPKRRKLLWLDTFSWETFYSVPIAGGMIFRRLNGIPVFTLSMALRPCWKQTLQRKMECLTHRSSKSAMNTTLIKPYVNAKQADRSMILMWRFYSCSSMNGALKHRNVNKWMAITTKSCPTHCQYPLLFLDNRDLPSAIGERVSSKY